MQPDTIEYLFVVNEASCLRQMEPGRKPAQTG
jgi:hypothetical protein